MVKAADAASKRNFAKCNDWDDVDMQSMFREDAMDWAKIALYLVQGKVRQASKKHMYMDTAARDECSTRLYDFLTGSPGGFWS